MTILLLGGTTEATALAHLLAARSDLPATLSLAGRTSAPRAAPIPTRVGGFGGVEGLVAYVKAQRIRAVVDATHPFAARMSRNAAQACRLAGVHLLALVRPEWTPAPGDRWTRVPDMAGAVAALGEAPKRVFLTVGRLELAAFEAAPQHAYLVRTIDPVGAVALPDLVEIRHRPPFDEPAERALMQAERIDVLVTKNSGADATRPKLDAARALGLPVIVVERPPRPPGVETVARAQEALAWLERVHAPAP
ncbi:cobalt-precorrin-6A reductase [Salinarimonas ramus]|uniref:Precorrin-6A reductase n=1 Tax=Salinarimonas ramus TaxID=690164 RepID=A0A917QKU2_9HYPH|nr:cobalt-precorrin-6A reductase [Salinarimonas ramus]GGK55371.1 precorrin-6A reductase [Salinarimonas ramus]